MTDNVIHLHPKQVNPPSGEFSDGDFPFVLKLQAKMEHVAIVAAHEAYVMGHAKGFWRGIRFMGPVAALALFAGFAIGALL